MGVQEQNSLKTTRILSSIPDFDDDTSSAILARACVEATVGAKTLYQGLPKLALTFFHAPMSTFTVN